MAGQSQQIISNETMKQTQLLLKETMDKLNTLVQTIDQRIGKMKGVVDLKRKLDSLYDTLRQSNL